MLDDHEQPSSSPDPSSHFDSAASSPPAPSLGSSLSADACEADKRDAVSDEIRRVCEIVRRHYNRQTLSELRDKGLSESCDFHLDPNAYQRLKEALRHDKLLTHFNERLRHDYSPQSYRLKLRLMVTPFHENFKSKFIAAIQSQLLGIASRLDAERDAIRPHTDTARRAALEATSRTIREIDDLSHATVLLHGGTGEAQPDGQFRHKSQIPQFVFEIGYSEEAASLQLSARNYIEETTEVKTVITVNTAYTAETLWKEYVRALKDQHTRDAASKGGTGIEPSPEGHATPSGVYESGDQDTKAAEDDAGDDIGSLQEDVRPVEGRSKTRERKPFNINRKATICLYRGERIRMKDAVIRDSRGTAQNGALRLSLNDFISDKTASWLTDLSRSAQGPGLAPLAPSDLRFGIPFETLTEMLRKGDEHQDVQDATPPPAGKRKLRFDVDDDAETGAENAFKRARRTTRAIAVAMGSSRRTRSMGSPKDPTG